MTYQSSHTGPELDAAVEMLGQIQAIRDESNANLQQVQTLAGAVDGDAQAASAAALTAAEERQAAAQYATDAEEAKVAAQAAAEAIENTVSTDGSVLNIVKL